MKSITDKSGEQDIAYQYGITDFPFFSINTLEWATGLAPMGMNFPMALLRMRLAIFTSPGISTILLILIQAQARKFSAMQKLLIDPGLLPGVYSISVNADHQVSVFKVVVQ